MTICTEPVIFPSTRNRNTWSVRPKKHFLNGESCTSEFRYLVSELSEVEARVIIWVDCHPEDIFDENLLLWSEIHKCFSNRYDD